MSERDIGGSIDKYLRRNDTYLAGVIRHISPQTGEEYLASDLKKVSDKLLASPLCLISIPVIGITALKIKLEDGGDVFYIQDRVGKDGNIIKIKKLRSLKMDSPPPDVNNSLYVKQFAPEDHPQVTKTGIFLRSSDLDELPQIWNVLQDEMSLVGVRILPEYALEFMEQNLSPNEFNKWLDIYLSSDPGIFNLNSEVSPNRKNDLIRRHPDRFYIRNASLGLDLYILFRTNMRVIKKIWSRIKSVPRPGFEPG